MAAELQIDYFTPEFEQFKQDVLNEKLTGVVVTKLAFGFGMTMAEDFRHNNVPEGKINDADIVITIVQQNCPAMVVARTQAGKMFIKTRKYSIMR